MSDDKKVIFSMSKLSKTYSSSDKQVLKNIYLSFFYGAKIGILGLNGSGKTTLIQIIRGKLIPKTGNVTALEKKSIYIDQDYSLLDNFGNLCRHCGCNFYCRFYRHAESCQIAALR